MKQYIISTIMVSLLIINVSLGLCNESRQQTLIRYQRQTQETLIYGDNYESRRRPNRHLHHHYNHQDYNDDYEEGEDHSRAREWRERKRQEILLERAERFDREEEYRNRTIEDRNSAFD